MPDSNVLEGDERDPLGQYTSTFTADRILVRSSLAPSTTQSCTSTISQVSAMARPNLPMHTPSYPPRSF